MLLMKESVLSLKEKPHTTLVFLKILKILNGWPVLVYNNLAIRSSSVVYLFQLSFFHKYFEAMKYRRICKFFDFEWKSTFKVIGNQL